MRTELQTFVFEHAAIDDITVITEAFEEKLADCGCSMRNIFQINIAIDEIYSNIVKYAYNGAAGRAEVSLCYDDAAHLAELVFRDGGVPFDPLTESAPDLTASAEERSVGGLGIFMIKKTMDSISYQYTDNSNVLTIGKKI